MKKRIINIVFMILLLTTIALTIFACGVGSQNAKPGELIFVLNGDNTYSVVGIGRSKSFEDNPQDVTIPAEYEGLPVTRIGEGAFIDFPIKTLTLPESITLYGAGAFSGCNIERINYSGSIAQWCNIYFADQRANPLSCVLGGLYIDEQMVVDLIIPNEVTTIGHYAFSGYKQLKKVDLGTGVTTIGAYAFNGCNGRLLTVIIGENVTELGFSPFANCYRITEVYNLSSLSIDEEGLGCGDVAKFAKAVYTSRAEVSKISQEEDYIYYVEDDKKTVIDYVGTAKDIVIPEGVIGIKAYAFHDSEIRNAVIPDSIRYVGELAFGYYNNEGVKTTEEQGVKYLGNPENPHLVAVAPAEVQPSEIRINNRTKVLADRALYDLYNDTTSVVVGENVQVIGQYSLSSNEQIQSVAMNDKIEEICDYAFSYVGVNSIVVPDSVVKMGKGVFMGSRAENIVIGTGINKIPDFTFRSSKFKSMTIPDHIEEIGYQAFRGCEELEAIDLGNVSVIQDEAFWWNIKLTNVVLPDSVTQIGASAFENCDELQNVTIGSSVKTVGEKAFANCPQLQSVTIKEGAEEIGTKMFSGCTSIAGISIPGSVLRIGDYAFSDVLGDSGYNLKTIVLNEGIESIGERAFRGNVESITLPKTLKYLGNEAFKDANLKSFDFIGEIADWVKITFDGKKANPMSYVEEFTFNGAPLTDVEIPSTISEIKAFTFLKAKDIERVSFSNKVETIGESAFADCVSLKQISTGNGVRTIGKEAFARSGVMKVDIGNNVRVIGESAFEHCAELMQVTLGNWLNTIEKDAFYECFRLVEIFDYSYSLKIYPGFYDITPPTEEWDSYTENDGCITDYALVVHTYMSAQSLLSVDAEGFVHYVGILDDDVNGDNDEHLIVNYIGSETRITTPVGANQLAKYAFYNKDNLKEVTISEGIEAVSWGAFRESDRLQRVTLSTTITSIGNEAFRLCENLEYVDVKEGLERIWFDAFEACHKLRRIYLPSTLHHVESMVFEGCNNLIEVYNNSGRYVGPKDWALGGAGYYAQNIYNDRIGKTRFVEEGDFVYYVVAGSRRLISYLGDDTEVILPAGIQAVHSGTFRSNLDVKKIVVPAGVTQIGDFALGGVALEEVVIPTTVTSIGHQAIGVCKIYYEGTEEQWNAIQKQESWHYYGEVEIVYNYKG